MERIYKNQIRNASQQEPGDDRAPYPVADFLVS